MKKIKKTDEQLINFFWQASDNCYFEDRTISLILHLEQSTLAAYRGQSKGPLFRKFNGRILYKKADILDYLSKGK